MLSILITTGIYDDYNKYKCNYSNNVRFVYLHFCRKFLSATFLLFVCVKVLFKSPIAVLKLLIFRDLLIQGQLLPLCHILKGFAVSYDVPHDLSGIVDVLQQFLSGEDYQLRTAV